MEEVDSSMRTSNKASAADGAKTNMGRALRNIAVTLLVVFVVDVLVSLALVPYVGMAELVWREYRANEAETFDTVLVGSSVVGYGISPMALDEELGSSSFNMGTPGQTLRDSLTSIRCAVADHDVSRVILGIGYETLLESPSINSSVSYTLSKCIGEAPWEAASDWASLLTYDPFFTSAYSLNAIFPFAYDHVELTVPSIADNISRRANMSVMDAAYAYSEASGGENWHYRGKGYSSYELLYPDIFPHGTWHASHPSTEAVVTENLDAIATICSWCKEHGVSLYVVSAPYMPTALVEYGDRWVEAMNSVSKIVESEGGHYLDLNVVKRERLNLLPTHFTNAVHLNHDGAALTSSFIGTLVRDIENGVDVSDNFLPLTVQGWRECRASIPFVDTIDYTTRTENGRVTLEASPITGNTDVRYRFEIKTSPDEDLWDILQDYSPDPTYSFVCEDGTHEIIIRVSAYATGEYEDLVRRVDGNITL